MKDIILGILPVLASCSSVVVVTLGFLKKVKKLVSMRDNETKYLKTELARTQEKYRETISKMEDEVNTLKEEVEKQAEVKAEVVKCNAQVVDTCNKLNTLVDRATTIKNQLNTLLRDKGE